MQANEGLEDSFLLLVQNDHKLPQDKMAPISLQSLDLSITIERNVVFSHCFLSNNYLHIMS